MNHFVSHFIHAVLLPHCPAFSTSALRAIIELREQGTPEFISPQLCAPYSPHLNPADNSVRGILQEKVHVTCLTDLAEVSATENRVGQAGTRRHCGSHSSSMASSLSYQRALRPMTDSLSIVFNFCHCTVSDFYSRC